MRYPFAPAFLVALALSVAVPIDHHASADTSSPPGPTLSITPSVAGIAPGSKFQLRALYDPDGPGAEPAREVNLEGSWTTSNSDIADVDQRGEVEGRSSGTAVVAVEYLNVFATATIAVGTTTPTPPPPSSPPPAEPGPPPPAPAARYEGFGGQTGGGEGKPIYRVTTLADSGPGSLRDAISKGDRHVVFDVAGEITAGSALQILGPFVTIDGFSAPFPGITITNRGLQIRGTKGAHDVIVRGIRVRHAVASSSTDCIQVSHGAFNVVLDHISVSGCADGGMDITGDPSNLAASPTRDVTVSWSILGPPVGNKRAMLIKYGTTRISLHHNLFVDTESRLPEVTREGLSPDSGTTLDMRNNVIWNWGPGYGTRVHAGVNANVVANLYGNPRGGSNDDRQGLIICRGDGVETAASRSLCGNGVSTERAQGFALGNVSTDGVDLDAMGNVSSAFAAPPVTTADACSAAQQVLAGAGAPFPDETDGRLTEIDLACSP